jgi:excisionase family DNA binding protein
MDTWGLLTKRQAAERFQVSTRTLDRWRAAGLLPAFKVGGTVRFRPADLERFLKKKVQS